MTTPTDRVVSIARREGFAAGRAARRRIAIQPGRPVGDVTPSARRSRAWPPLRGMPGLRSKVFTVDPEHDEAINVYVWDDADAARAFFNDELLARVTSLYGVRPTIRFVEITDLVDNAH
jgi:hypothetical protein